MQQTLTIINTYITHVDKIDQNNGKIDADCNLLENEEHIIIGGDFNASLDPNDKGKTTKNIELQKYKENNDLINHNYEFDETNIQGNSRRCIDYLLTDDSIGDKVIKYQTLNIGGGNDKINNKTNYHKPIMLQIKIQKEKDNQSVLNYNLLNQNTYQQDMKNKLKEEEYKLEDINNRNDIEKEARKLNKCIMECVRKQLKPQKISNDRGWIPSQRLQELTDYKHKCFKKASKCVSQVASQRWKEEGERIGKICVELQNLEMKKHDETNCNQLSKEPFGSRKFWSTVNKLSGIQRTTYNCRNLKYKNKRAMSLEEKAKLHLEYQQDVFQENKPEPCAQCTKCRENKECTDVNDYWKTHIEPTYKKGIELLNNAEKSETIPEITMLEIKNALKATKKRKAGGKDEMKSICLHYATDEMLNRIRNLYNHCIKLNHQPKEWKHAIIILLAKPGKDHTKPDGYRPISLLAVMGKLLDRIISKRYRSFLNKAKNKKGEPIIPHQQRGFTEGAQTNDLIFNLHQTIADAIYTRNQAMVAALDASKAFDRAPHKAILAAITELVITNQMPKYILSYYAEFLKERTFQIKMKNHITKETGTMYAGVPQGSVSAPHLYLHLTASIPKPDEDLNKKTLQVNKIEKQNERYEEYLKHLQTNKQELGIFADDTATWARIGGKPTTKRKLDVSRFQIYLNEIYRWANRLKIKFNIDKNQLMISKPEGKKYKRLKQEKMKLGPMDLKYEKELKYLGIIYDHDLRLKTEMKETLKKCKTRIKKLKSLSERSNIHPTIAKRWHMALVVPIFMYRILAWYPDPKKREKIEELYQQTNRAAYRVPPGTTNRSLELMYTHKEINFKKWYNDIKEKWFKKATNNCKIVREKMESSMEERMKRVHHNKNIVPVIKKIKTYHMSPLEICHEKYTIEKFQTIESIIKRRKEANKKIKNNNQNNRRVVSRSLR